ncbi:MAG TPA: choice-of-anchor D domain-containing protein [Terriglobales bacterium]|nr:choice-of-anchor D domain-containing protein [Terriglobales bacterium]
MPGTVTNHEVKGCWSVLTLSLVVVLVGGICVSGYAQSNARRDLSSASLASASPTSARLKSSPPTANFAAEVDPWIQQREVTASDGAAQDQFGNSVAISGNTMVVGSPDHSFGTTYGAGAAYVFVETGGTWSQQAELKASDGAAYDAFGLSVTISGTTIMVGAPCHTNSNGQCGQGAVYVFVASGGKWTQQAELTASNGVAGDYFGWSVALDGNTAVIGAYGKEIMGHAAQGAAYVFAESGGTWTQQAELTASDGIFNDEFGYSVGLNSSTIVIGAPDRTVGSNQSQGTGYVFTGSGGTWTQQAELTASDGEAGDFFAQSVAVGGSTTVLGAPCHPRNGFAFCQGGSGAAYVFGESGGTWTQQAELTPSDGVAGDEFGVSVSFSGSTILSGASLHTVGSNQGAAYVFTGSGGTWSQQAELAAADDVGGYFGWSVAVDGTTAIVGAPAHAVGSNQLQGAAYVFVPSVSTVSISPTSLSFGNVAINSTSAAKTVTLKNSGSTTLDISSITASTHFAVSSNTCGATLASGKTCKISVTFTPTQLGPLTGTLSFTDNAAGSPQTVPLSGAGITEAKLSPASAAYPKQKVGTTSTAKTFTLTNNQTVALTSIAISTTGDFAVSATTCTTSLPAKGKCTISVTFKPTAIGKRTGQLRVGDSANNSPQTSNLTGTGE